MIFSSFERQVAWRYLWPQKKVQKREGFITLIGALAFLGIMLGVATLIIVMSVMNGFRTELIDKIIGFNGDISVQALSGPLYDYEKIAQEIKKEPYVATVVPLIEGQSMAVIGKTATGLLVRGISSEDLVRHRLVSQNIVRGSLENFSHKDALVIGVTLARSLNLHIGQTVRLLTPEMNSTAFGSVPRYKDFKVAAVYESGNSQYDKGVVFIPLKTAQVFYRLEDDPEAGVPSGVSGLEVFLTSPLFLDKVKENIEELTKGERRVLDWRQSNRAFFEAVMTERNVMFLILTLIIIIAAFNIISSMVILVKDKTREIGILRTMGATQGAILRVFFLTGATLGVTGTCGGVIIGLLFCWNIEHIRHGLEALSGTSLFSPEIYFLSKLPAIVETGEVFITVATALCITFIFTLIPAWRAAHLNPIQALRNE